MSVKAEKLRRKYFGDAAFYKMAMLVAVPIMIQNGITNFVGLLDNIMVGSVGTLQMSGVGIANQLLMVFNLTIFGAISGAGIFGAQFYGKGDTNGVRNAFRFKLMIGAFILLVGVLVFTMLDEPLIRVYLTGEGDAADIEATMGYAKEYLHIILFSLVPFVLAQCYSGTLRECGQTVVPMVAGIVSVCVNLCFNALLIYGLLGFPALGSRGAALATMIARYVEAAIVIVWTHRHSLENRFIIGAYRHFGIPSGLGINILKKTVPLMTNEMLWSGGMAMLTAVYSMHGLNVVSAMTISSTLSNVFNVAFIAMGSAVGIIVGQLLGAGKVEEAVDTDRKLIVFAVLICFVIGGAVAVLAPYFPLLYQATEEVSYLASQFIMISALCMPICSMANACYFTLRSGGKTIITFLFDSCFVCLITLPLAYLLTKCTGITIIPLYAICTFIEIFKCIIGYIMIKRGVWIHNIVND